MNTNLFEVHAKAYHWDLWQLGMQHMQETWPQWTDEVLPCVWCNGSLVHTCLQVQCLLLRCGWRQKDGTKLSPLVMAFELRSLINSTFPGVIHITWLTPSQKKWLVKESSSCCPSQCQPVSHA